MLLRYNVGEGCSFGSHVRAVEQHHHARKAEHPPDVFRTVDAEEAKCKEYL
jgi:hypothetical protein